MLKLFTLKISGDGVNTLSNLSFDKIFERGKKVAVFFHENEIFLFEFTFFSLAVQYKCLSVF